MSIAADAGLNYSELNTADFLWLSAKLKSRRKEHIFFWNIARFVSFFAVKPYDVKNRLKSFSDLIEFDWERSSNVVSKRFTEEELKAFHAGSVALFDKLKSVDNAGGINS